MQLKNKILSFVLLWVVMVAIIFLEVGCASVAPPSGGPRDSLPPQIVEVNPPNESVNFKGKTITLDFDEYVDVEDIYKNLIISPLPKVFPEVQRKLKKVTVKIKDTLENNTTYVYNFENVIKDINEGNRAKNMLYVVSTGTYFDSLELSGNVKLAQTAKPDSTLRVMLHSNMDDSAVIKEKPRYVARVDSNGYFMFRYLAPGKYRLYAIKDEGGSYLYTSNQQLFAFADSPVVISTIPPDPIRLYAYNYEEEKKIHEEEPELNKKEKRLKFQTNLQGTEQDLLEPLVFNFESALKNFDPSKMILTTDSTFDPISGYRFSIDSARHTVTMNLSWKEGTTYNLILAKDFASDSLDRELFKTDTIKFVTKYQKDYGQAKITFQNLDMSVNPVLLILQNNIVKNAFPLNSNILEIKLYTPGDYDLQVLYDKNKNQKWDPGDFFNGHLQPEIVVPLDRKLNIKANWTIEPEIKLIKPNNTVPQDSIPVMAPIKKDSLMQKP